MAILSAFSRRSKVVASTVVLAIAAGVPLTFAVLHQGFPVTDVDLESKNVWVTNGPDLLAGRMNRQIEELDAGVEAGSTNIDVIQNGDLVFLHDIASDTLERIDPSYTTLLERTEIPSNSEITLGGTTLSIVNPANGDLWVVDVTNELSFDPTATDPDLKLGAGGHATVTSTGKVFATSVADGTIYTMASFGAKATEAKATIPKENQISAVGDSVVILDTAGDKLIFGDGKTQDLGADGIKLQQVSAAHDYALVASGEGLLEVPMGGGEPTAISADIAKLTEAETVSAPVWLDGCAHGAWAGAQRYLQACDGSEPSPQTIEQPTIGMHLEFRVNKKVIALNNLDNGNAWVIKAALRLVDNWDEVTPPEEEDTTDGKEKSAQESFEDTLATRTDKNRKPTARPDKFGVREGRTTILPVLNNDTDPDGDVLVITNFSQISEKMGRVDAIDGGRALQFTPGAAKTGSASLRYTVSDGRTGGVAETTVDIRIVPADQNNAPEEMRSGAAVSVESGQTTSYNVLPDWLDPDGDDLFLSAAAPTSGDLVRFTPDGFITFQHKSGSTGKKTVNFVVSDGDKTATGKLVVNVKAAGSLAPIATPDFAEAFIGETVVVEPLKNDLSTSGKSLKLLSVDEVPADATVSTNLDTGTVSVSSQNPGAIYLKYALGSGTESTIGLIRIEMREEPNKPEPPIAVKDIAYLRQGEPFSVKVLNNDVSPAGNVLAVQSVDTSKTNDAVSVEVLNNTIIRVSVAQALTEQTQFEYTVSDGEQTATAGVTVVPVPPIVNRQPPVAVDDRVSVRAGDIVSVPVLKNDYHPDQAKLILDPELADVENDGGGLTFINGDAVRYQAPKKAGEYRVVYRVADQYGESATATVTFVVNPEDLENNRPPAPAPQTARTFSGSTVRIDVPLDSIDPDGDSVVLNGYTERPTMGRITESASDHFVYEAYADAAGTDTFRYEVQDTFGARSVGLITVGVIPRADVTAPPNAVDDSIEVKPGKIASVQPLANDSDPNGFAISLVKELSEVPKGITAKTDGNKVIVTAPKEEGGFSIRYQIDNGEGGVDYAFITVKVTKNAKTVYPSAEDYYVPVSDVVGSKPVKVNVLELINNPNGLDSDMLITAEGPNAKTASVSQDNGTVTVTPGDARIAIAYRVTDPIDETLVATAFIIVPPEVSASYSPPPYVRLDLKPQIVTMNGEKEWDLEDILVVPSGRPAVLTDTAKVVAAHSDGSALTIDKNTLHFAAAKDFRGQTDIVFEVTDGKDASDINGNKALLTLPITVGDPNFEDVAPTFTQLDLEIEAGEDAQTVDLRESTAHPNRSLIPSFSYSDLSGATNDIEASLRGSELTVSAPRGVQPGATTTLRASIKYKEFTVPAIVTVRTVRSTRPLPSATTDEEKGQRSKPTTVNVVANDFNPFSQDGEPLTLIDAKVDNAAESSATVSHTEDGNVTITPNAAFIGVVSVVYTIQDATKDDTRNAQGRFLLTVRDVPDQVAPEPAIVSESDKSVTISWKTPATNGEPILDYTISWTGGGKATVPASQGQYEATGLTNGDSYAFQVKARNVLGDGALSNASATARPFGKPGKVPSASLDASSGGDARLTMTWGAASGNGRDVDQYVWTLSNGTTGKVGGGTTSATATGKVGTSYTFTVKAVGPTGLEGDSSDASAARTPTPGAPSSATATARGKGDATVDMSWGAAQSDGQAVDQYQVSINGGAWENKGTARSSTGQGAFNTGFSFRVRAVTNGSTGAETGSNTATPQDVDPPTITMVSKSATNYTCSDGTSPCNRGWLQASNLEPGSYTVSLQYLQGGTWHNAGSLYQVNISANGYAQSRNYLGTKPYDGVRMILNDGPSGLLETNHLSPAQWNALPNQDH